MIKRYSSACVKFTINVKVNGKQTPVVFDRYNQDTKRRFIDISDPEIQKQMEKSADFNVYFCMDYSIVDPNDLIVKEFSNWKDAKSWLNDEFEIPFKELPNKASVVSKAHKLGFELNFTTD